MSAKAGVAQASHKAKRVRPDTSWLEMAKCVGEDPQMFFDPKRYGEALNVCRGCFVKMACRQYGRGDPGVWGGQVNEEKS